MSREASSCPIAMARSSIGWWPRWSSCFRRLMKDGEIVIRHEGQERTIDFTNVEE